MTRLLLLAAILLTACKGTTGPNMAAAGIDPTVLVTNQTSYTGAVRWFDQRTGILSVMDAPPGTTCIRFTVPTADSIYVQLFDSIPGSTTRGWSDTPLFVVGQPYGIVNGVYVSDFFTGNIGWSPTSSGGQFAPALHADSLAPC